MNLYTWHPMTEPPTKSGAYLVGHRGTQAVRQFFARDRKWYAGTVLGWQGDMNFAPSHWMGYLLLESTGANYAARMAAINAATYRVTVQDVVAQNKTEDQ